MTPSPDQAETLEQALEPCPFCGGDAEMDTRQGYANYVTGRPETGIAIYCRDCGVQHMVCRGDVPDIEPEQVVEMWNHRAASPPPPEVSEEVVEADRRVIIETLREAMRIGVQTDNMEWEHEQRERESWAVRHAETILALSKARQIAALTSSAEPSDPVGCAERDVGRYVYRLVSALMDSPEGSHGSAELAYLSRIVSDVEEYGVEGLSDEDFLADVGRWCDPLAALTSGRGEG